MLSVFREFALRLPVARLSALSLVLSLTHPSPAFPQTTQPTSAPSAPRSAEAGPELSLDGGARILQQVQDAIVKLVRRVDPCVVTIQADRMPSNLGGDEDVPARTWMSTGAGVIIRRDGMILTSQHVIDRASAIYVVLHDGRTVQAIPIAEDRRADLAVIRITGGEYQAAQLAESDSVKRGNIVVALGNPLGLAGDGQAAVSHGVISAIGRPLPENFGRDEDRYYGDMIQTTAPISPGNSGGPLIDIHGCVVGIITAVSTRSDGHEGIGFAVPINRHTRAIVDRLLRGQPIEYGYLGVEVEPVPSSPRSSGDSTSRDGVVVNSVFPGGPAERAGLRGGDRIVTVNGEPARSVENFVRIIGALGPQHVASIRFVRAEKKRTANVTLTRRPSGEPKAMPEVRLSFRGAELGTVKPATRLMANLPENALLVMRVDGDSPADRAGLTPGDIVVRVDGNSISQSSFEAFSDQGREIVLGLANGGSIIVKQPPAAHPQ
ncbi:MAG TPA: trypsin-like peptidase domain-containing protein [Phycisphaerae bacterium]|nr:trypsin-like peptidase domain-containing protein [Phycisphaerae bacterium]